MLDLESDDMVGKVVAFLQPQLFAEPISGNSQAVLWNGQDHGHVFRVEIEPDQRTKPELCRSEVGAMRFQSIEKINVYLVEHGDEFIPVFVETEARIDKARHLFQSLLLPF